MLLQKKNVYLYEKCYSNTFQNKKYLLTQNRMILYKLSLTLARLVNTLDKHFQVLQIIMFTRK